MAAAIDPVGVLTYALSCPADSSEQAQALRGLRSLLFDTPQGPSTIPALAPALLTNVVRATDSLFKRFTLEMVAFALSTTSLSIDIRTKLASECLESAATLLAAAENTHILKLVIQCFCSIYPLLFRAMCTARVPTNRQPWDILTISKRRIIDFIDNSPPVVSGAHGINNLATSRLGIRVAALKFVQRIILVGTRLVQDPRLQRLNFDPNLSYCPSNHPFIDAAALEAESNALLLQIITILYTSSSADVVSAVVNTFSSMAKLRPALGHPLIEALNRWVPEKLVGSSLESPSRVRSAEKAVYICLNHLLRTDVARPFASEISRALDGLAERIRNAARIEQIRRTEVKRLASAPTPGTPPDAKRIKLEALLASTPAPVFEGIDWRAFSANIVTDVIVANLQRVPDAELAQAIATYRASRAVPNAPLSLNPISAPVSSSNALDEEEMEYEPEKLNMQLETAAPTTSSTTDIKLALEDEEDEFALQLGTGATFELPLPRALDPSQTTAFLRATISRLSAPSSALIGGARGKNTANRGVSPGEMWILLLIRLVSRAQPYDRETDQYIQATKKEEVDDMEVMDLEGKVNTSDHSQIRARNDALRGMILDYVMVDLPARLRIATLWLNEEWFNDESRSGPVVQHVTYNRWLDRLLTAYRPKIDSGDRTLAALLLDLPNLPPSVFTLLAELCVSHSTTIPGLEALRELVTMRPPVRATALRIILDLTTHPETMLRISAIKAVKRWVPDVQPMDSISRRFAVRLLRRLKHQQNGQDTGMHDETAENHSETDTLSTPYLSPNIDIPARPVQILQHVQLIFALCVKVPDLLDEIFLTYPHMAEFIQSAVLDHFAPVVRSISGATGTPAYAKLLTLLRNFLPGAESLALRVIRILTDGGRPSAVLVSLVKSLIAERDLDARFLVPIIGELEKSEIIRQIPRIVAMLSGAPGITKPGEEKALVRNVFVSVLEKPESDFGKSSTNLPRIKASQLLEPTKLLVLLHESPDINLKNAREAIQICFDMPDLFPSEVLAVATQQLVDNPTLPPLFMRTVIQAVKTYKTLIPFVARNLMTRLIQKKIWTLGSLWDGFQLCAKIIAPSSHSSLLLLPPQQLAEVTGRYPELRTGLRDFVIKKGGNNARYLDVLGRPDSPAVAPSQVIV